MKKVLIYANGGQSVGLGHIVRMISFASYLKGFQIYFVSDNKSRFSAGHDLVKNSGFELVKIQTLDEILEIKAEFLIVDSYDVSAEFFTKSKMKFKKVMCIDDECELGFYDVDYIFNQNLYAKTLPYKTSERTEKIFEFLCLRDEFLGQNKIHIKNEITDILLTLGGSDDKNLTKKIILSLSEFLKQKNITLHIVIGKAFKFRDEIISFESKNIKCYENAKMVDLMKNCDIAICGLGQTAYELFCLGVPILGLILAKNQENLAKFGSRKGILVSVEDDKILENLQNLNYEKRLAMRKNIDNKFKFRHINELNFDKIFC